MSGSHTMTSSFVEVTGEGEKKLAPDSCTVGHRSYNRNRKIYQQITTKYHHIYDTDTYDGAFIH